MRIPSSFTFVRGLGAPSRWDFVVLPGMVAVLFAIAWGSQQMARPLAPEGIETISLDPRALPGYALLTTLRMLAALAASLLFTLVYATWAAKSRRAEQILVPVLDVLQSVPILGFLSLTVTGFLHLFPGSRLGPEMAAIFAIFTSQAWNMTFSFYRSLRMVPRDLALAADAFGLSAWQRFWKLELPHGIPGLVWNAMMSVAGGWFFVVASEAITVADQNILLPGVGSYIAVAIRSQNLAAIGYALLAMAVVILLWDQLLFRPLVAWAHRFKMETTTGAEPPRSWLLTLLLRSRWLSGLARRLLALLWETSLRLVHAFPRASLAFVGERVRLARRWGGRLWFALLAVLGVAAAVALARYVLSAVGAGEVVQVLGLGLITAARVYVLLALASLVWVPVGVWIGLSPRLAARVQPVVLFLSAFPANLLFPLAVMLIARHRLDPEIWVSPLMILGTQWYILFNAIAGAVTLPQDLKEVAATLGVRGWQWWKRVALPAVFPAYVTGGLTASGGAWNASVVAEVVNWGTTTLTATGLGAYIAEQTARGDHHRVALGIAVMSLYVVLVNRLFWTWLARLAERRMVLE